MNADQPETSPPGRLAALDYGTVRIGVAVSDSRQTLASPYENYSRQGSAADAAFFQELARREQIVRWIVGLPVSTSGFETPKSLEVRRFGQWLGELTGLSVEYYDERFTSVEAEQLLGGAGLTKKQKKARLDKLAAQLLLAGYLESTRRGELPPALDA